MPARPLLPLLLACLLTATVVAPAGAAASLDVGGARSIEAQLAHLLDRDRARAGLAPLRRVAGVDNVAREQAAAMALAGRPSHRADLTAPFDGAWRRLGENVGVGTTAAAIHDGFRSSSAHRRNLLGAWTHVGIGVALRGDAIWVAVTFVDGDPSTTRRYDRDPLWGRYALGSGERGPYRDLGSTVHAADVEALDGRRATVSCATARYCPDEPLRRAEVAAMLTRALRLPAASEQFRDVASGHPYAADIGALAASGITVGCNPPANDRFCPEDTVTRAQVASFLTRAFDLDRSSERGFVDVPDDNVHASTIAALADARITVGCNPPANDRYCPRAAVTRGQMASFLVRALGP